MRIFIIILISFITIAIFGFKLRQKPEPAVSTPEMQSTSSPLPTTINAGFTIFTNGTKRDFSNNRYHNQSPDVFLEATNPQIVIVMKAGVTWNDFFKTLPMKLTNDCLTTGTSQQFCNNEKATLKFYLNGIQDQFVLSKIINDNDWLLVSYGPRTDSNLEEQLKEANIIPFL